MQYLGPYSEEYGFALVIPEGYKRSFNAKSSFCCGGALDEDVDDVGFLVDIKTNVRDSFVRACMGTIARRARLVSQRVLALAAASEAISVPLNECDFWCCPFGCLSHLCLRKRAGCLIRLRTRRS